MLRLPLALGQEAQETDPEYGWLEPSKEKKKKSGELFVKGAQALNQGDWQGACDLLNEAWSLHIHWQIAGNLGICELELKSYKRAAEHLAFYLETMPAPPGDPKRVEAEAHLAKAKKHIGTLRIRVRHNGRPHDSAIVSVDSDPLGRGAEFPPHFVDPGRHRLWARTEDMRLNREIEVDVSAGTERDIEVELLLRRSEPVKPAAKPPARPVAPPAPEPARWTPLEEGGIAALLTLGVSALGTGVLWTFLANEEAGDADRVRERVRRLGPTESVESTCSAPNEQTDFDCMALEAYEGDISTYTTLAVTSYIAGGLLTTAGSFFLVRRLSSSPTSSTGRRVSLSPSVQGGPGITVMGAF